jgi:hypothetical protein
VKAAMGSMMGSRGGVDIPEADRKACYSHLSKHYDQFGKEPPMMKVLELTWAVSSALGWMEDEKPTLHQVEKIASNLQELNELLRAEPKRVDDLALLTQKNLVRRLELSKRTFALLNQ